MYRNLSANIRNTLRIQYGGGGPLVTPAGVLNSRRWLHITSALHVRGATARKPPSSNFEEFTSPSSPFTQSPPPSKKDKKFPTGLERDVRAENRIRAEQNRRVPLAVRCEAVMSDEFCERLASNEYRARRHPGKRRVPTVSLPSELQLAMERVISKHYSGPFAEHVERIQKFVAERRRPPARDSTMKLRNTIKSQLLEEENVNLKGLDVPEKDEILNRINKRADELVAHKAYAWKQVDYEEADNPILFMAARMAANYAALYAVFNEIHRSLGPVWRPRTIFDFGSGAGSVFWAARSIFGHDSLSEYFCVDSSKEQNDLNRLLLQGGDENQPITFGGIFFRQYLPVSSTIKYDLVVSAHSLLDQPNSQARINAIENLWHKTHDLLVIVEHGTTEGFGCVLQARDFILRLGGQEEATQIIEPAGDSEGDLSPSDPSQVPRAHVLAPCPHDLTCPRRRATGPVLCNYQVRYYPFDVGQDTRKRQIRSEPYSYVVLRKRPRDDGGLPTWPRIVQPVLARDRHVMCRLCIPDGKIGELRLSKGNTQKELYRCARVAEWGDLLPATIQEVPPEIMAAKREFKKNKKLIGQSRHRLLPDK